MIGVKPPRVQSDWRASRRTALMLPDTVSLSDLPPTPPGPSWLGLFRRPVDDAGFRLTRLIEPVLYELDDVMQRPEVAADAPDPFYLDYRQYHAVQFYVGEGRNVVSTRHSKAIGMLGQGFISAFNVGGADHLRRDLIGLDMLQTEEGWTVDQRDVETVEGFSVPLCHYGYCAFGHFALDALLQVFLFRDVLARGEGQLVHWQLERTWMAPMLEACGVPARSRRELKQPVAMMRRAGLSSALAAQGVYYPNALSIEFFAWLRAMFAPDVTASPGRLYVHRDPAYGREIVNQPELESLLASHGFQVVCTDAMPLPEQVRLFASSEMVVSPFGSGLTLAPLLGGARRAVELLPSSTTDAWFTRQVAVHRLRYHPIVHASAPDGSFEADLERVDRFLAGLSSEG